MDREAEIRAFQQQEQLQFEQVARTQVVGVDAGVERLLPDRVDGLHFVRPAQPHRLGEGPVADDAPVRAQVAHHGRRELGPQ